ncbi:BTB/POZ protein [Rhizophagus irregularis DAOM 181602=DAOM 197198]|nr:BTB/POZ protein [Rhizophagus irregularis DAOM 181602=DAOM 197198]
MSKQFFPNLSQNYIEILKDDNYYDITIEVGNDPNVKIFRAHMIILYYRSPFLRRTLSSNKKNDNGALTHIKLSNISPDIFQIILKYIYGGFISLNEQEPSEILKVLAAADQLLLQELVDYLQTYLIENKSEFFSLSADEFVQKVRPYKKLLGRQLYEELLNSYLNSDSKPNDNILLPRYRNIDGIIDSRIVNLNVISLISRWIDNVDVKSKFAYTRELYLPYEFKLLLRGSKDGFTPKKFHELCDDSILSYVQDMNRALFYHAEFGPTFGSDDITIGVDDSEEYDCCWCKQESYKKKIRDTDDLFSIEDYEVFQIIKKDD